MIIPAIKFFTVFTLNAIDLSQLNFLKVIHKNNILIVSSYFCIYYEKNKYVYSKKLFSFNTKPINLIQIFPHIIESCACIL